MQKSWVAHTTQITASECSFLAIGIFVFQSNIFNGAFKPQVSSMKIVLQFTHPQVYAKYSKKERWVVCGVNRHRVSEKKNLLNLFEIF